MSEGDLGAIVDDHDDSSEDEYNQSNYVEVLLNELELEKAHLSYLQSQGEKGEETEAEKLTRE